MGLFASLRKFKPKYVQAKKCMEWVQNLLEAWIGIVLCPGFNISNRCFVVHPAISWCYR